jgi:phosphate transport system permease protein
MSTLPAASELTGHRRLRDWIGDRLLLGLTLAAAAAAVALIVLIALKVFRSAHLAFSTFGLSFVWHSSWDVNKAVFGALPGLYGTAVSSLIALLIATPLALAIALFLSELAPTWARVLVGSLVETLAAIPSVVLGLWGILVLGPLAADHLEPWLNRWFGWLQIFSGQPSSSGILIAGLILAIMVVPIIASICRELFLQVPSELEEGALALGASRWRTVVGIILPASLGGILTGTVLAVARAVGETAPLLFATGIFGRSVQLNPRHAMPNMPVQIFIWSESPDPLDHKRAWATALVLMTLVLVMSLIARIALNWTRRNTTR